MELVEATKSENLIQFHGDGSEQTDILQTSHPQAASGPRCLTLWAGGDNGDVRIDIEGAMYDELRAWVAALADG